MSSVKHNNRDLTEKEWQEPAHNHIIRKQSDDNIYLKQENLKEVYEKLFGEALKDYNDNQKRKDRKINDFYYHVKKSKTLDLQREFIVGLGTKTDWDSLPREKKLQAGEKLAEYIIEFERRHPHLYIYNAAVHLDEAGAPHAHFNVVPIASGYKNGLKLKPSFKKALANEGYKDNGRTLLKHFKDDEVKVLEKKLQELGYQRREVGTNDIKDLHEYKRIVNQANKDLEQILVADYGAPEYINETTGDYYDLIEYHNFTEFPREEDDGQKARKTTVQEKMNWVENRFNQIDKEFWKLDEEVHHLETQKQVLENMILPEVKKGIANKEAEISKLSEKIKRQKEGYEKNESILQKQKNKIKELAKYDVQDYQSWKESKELVQELETITPKRFSGNFLFNGDLVKRLKTFVMTIVDKLDKARSRNNLLERTLEEATLREQELKKDNQRLADYTTELKTKNSKLKEANKSLKGSERLLEDIEEVLTEKEVKSINKRLEALKRSREASRGWDNPNQSKGRSI